MKIIRKEIVNYVSEPLKKINVTYFNSQAFPGFLHRFDINGVDSRIVLNNAEGEKFKVDAGQLLEVNITVRNKTKNIKWESTEYIKVTKVEISEHTQSDDTILYVKDIEGKTIPIDYSITLGSKICVEFTEGVEDGFVIKEGDFIEVEVDIQVIDNNPNKERA